MTRTASPTRIALVAALALVMVASLASASNMGFKININRAPAGANNHPISIPYFYNPTDLNGNGLDSEDLCKDINGGTYVSGTSGMQFVKRYNTSSSSLTTHNCAIPAGGNFSLIPGNGYFIGNQPGITINSPLVGSHNNSLGVTYAPSGANNNLWSMPYHIMLTDANGNGMDSEDLCKAINSGTYVSGTSAIQFIKRYNTSADSLTTHNCAIPAGGNFSLYIGTAYFLGNQPGITLTSWVPPHY